jgi:hypothetical protein
MAGLEIKTNIKATTIINIFLTFISHLLFLIYSPDEKSGRKLNHPLSEVLFFRSFYGLTSLLPNNLSRILNKKENPDYQKIYPSAAWPSFFKRPAAFHLLLTKGLALSRIKVRKPPRRYGNLLEAFIVAPSGFFPP